MDAAALHTYEMPQETGEPSGERLMMRRFADALSPATILVRRQTSEHIELSVQKAGWKLSTIVIGREAASRLREDPAGEIKLDYLVRDLQQSGVTRERWFYPRLCR